jgi:hypothetical protein
MEGGTACRLANMVNGTHKRQPSYTIFDEHYGFELLWRPRQSNSWPINLLVQKSQGEDRPRWKPMEF